MTIARRSVLDAGDLGSYLGAMNKRIAIAATTTTTTCSGGPPGLRVH